jgi:uncharacterized protein
MNLPPLPNAYSYIASPCVGVCRINAQSQLCDGCLRSGDEIALWGKLADRDKFVLLKQLAQREQALPEGW